MLRQPTLSRPTLPRPTLSRPVTEMNQTDDEATFAALSLELASAIESHLQGWITGSILQRAQQAGVVLDADARERATQAGQRCRDEVGPKIRALLTSDIDDQRSTPLVLLRSATSFATEVLADWGVPHTDRDAYELRAFPLDIYGLSPASLADVHESLAEPGVVWGAAKAYLHRKRHGA